MKISIITTVYNNKETIEDALISVFDQTYSNIELIVVDGGSTDGTVEIIDKYKSKISSFISEPDSGIYNGLNKGIKLATGDVICFLHSDDIYSDSSILNLVANEFKDDNIDGVYGNLVYTSKDDTSTILRYWKSCEFKPNLLRKGWMPAHPTFFLKKEIYDKYGCFDETFKIAADYDFMLRVLTKNVNLKFLDFVLYKMRVGGVSNKSLTNIIKKSKEDYRALKKNKVGGVTTLILKNTQKLSQFKFKIRT